MPPSRVDIAPPLALPGRTTPILLMIAAPALLIGILGTLAVMYVAGSRSIQSGFFPLVGLVGFGALMFGNRFGRGRRISWGEQERQRRSYLRRLDEDREEVQRVARGQRENQLFVHGDPQRHSHRRASDVGRRPTDPDFLDVRSVWACSPPPTPRAAAVARGSHREELEPVTGRALRDFILEQSKIRGIGKVLSLRAKPGFSVIGQDRSEVHAFIRSVLCSLATYHSPTDLKLIVVSRHPDRWSWLVWLPHNRHDDLFDACGPRRLVFTSPTHLEDTLDAELHRKGRGPWTPPTGSSPITMSSTVEAAAPGPHWIIVDDSTGTPDQWEGITGQKGMSGITMLRLSSRPGVGIGFGEDDQRFDLIDGRLRHRGSMYAVADMLAESTATRYARAMARWSTSTGPTPETAGAMSAPKVDNCCAPRHR